MASKATVRAYTSPTLVLLAMNWADGADHNDFLGFAILRSPGFDEGEKQGSFVKARSLRMAAGYPGTQ
jgi:hypothetical protein